MPLCAQRIASKNEKKKIKQHTSHLKNIFRFYSLARININDTYQIEYKLYIKIYVHPLI